MKKSAIQSTRRRRLAIIDSLLPVDSEGAALPFPELAPGDPVRFRWSYPDVDDLFPLSDGRDTKSTGIVVAVDDTCIPAHVTVLWSTGRLEWDYADELTKIMGSRQ